ncbi:MAG: N-acylglucosamine 2-epimerase [Spirochaetia bacterium]|nr:N-acylglucosamine 2-epimerase [Spirochaetia bacterium]
MLLDNVLPFWLNNGFDRQYGGMLTGLDREGSLLETDKSIWFQGRALWVFSEAARIYSRQSEYQEVCASLVEFIEKHGFDPTDGRMYFRVSREGKPIVKRIRYVFSETFAIIGFASYSRAFGKKEYAIKAYDLFKKVLKTLSTKDLLVPKFERQSKGFGVPMILLNTVQELREACPEHKEELTSFIDDLLQEIEQYFVRPELEIVVEQCSADGSLELEHFEGRLLNPGHAIEGAWFIMREARYRENNTNIMNLGTKMLDWMWKIGWDTEKKGIIYFRDALGRSATDYWHDMKFWWPQCEASIANLMAFILTEKEEYLNQFIEVDRYIKANFVDEEAGEWYGYLHHDNSLSTPLKGNMFKGPFHIPRMYLVCASLLNELSLIKKN